MAHDANLDFINNLNLTSMHASLHALPNIFVHMIELTSS
jgi:hypothetical protein